MSIGSHAAALPALSWLNPSSAQAADDDQPLNRFPRMVHEFFVQQVRESGQRHMQKLNRLKTKADAEQYVRDAQQRIREAFGDEPERTPLNPRVTGTVEREDYRIENVIFDSRPGFPVTANLYIPKGRTGPLPAVVGTLWTLHQRKGGGSLSIVRSRAGSAGLHLFDLRPDRSRRTAAICQGRSVIADRRGCA